MLVPMFAPIMIPIACETFIMPEFTNPTTITVVAEDDWIIAVTPAPKSIPLSGVFVRRYKTGSNLFPATRFRPSPISDIPNKNSATPLKSNKIDVIPIFVFLIIGIFWRSQDTIVIIHR